MGQLATLASPPDMPPKKYTPGNIIEGWISLGETYFCQGLKDTPYSRALKQIIFECLYVNPAFRPNLVLLKARVQEGWRAAQAKGPRGEPWADFVHPEPEEPDWDPDAWNPDEDDDDDEDEDDDDEDAW